MACGDWDNYREALVDGAIWDAILCPYTNAMGAEVFAVIFFAPVVVSLYFITRSVAVPAVVCVVAGGVIISTLPASFSNAAMALLVIGLGVGAWLLTMRARRQ